MKPLILPGKHAGLSREQYDAIDAVNQSSLKALVRQSPMHYRHALEHPEAPSAAMELGTAVHLACYEPARFAESVVAAPDVDRRTKAGREAYEAFQAEAAGKIILAADDHDRVTAMQQAVLAHPAARRAVGLAGDREVTLVWDDAETGVRCKGRLDHLSANATVVLDLKTTRNAHPAAFSADIDKLNYHVQAAFYVDGVVATLGGEPPSFVFVVVESEAPHAVAVYELGAASIELGRIKYREALSVYAECRRTGRWPGYADFITEIEVPAWALARAGLSSRPIEE